MRINEDFLDDIQADEVVQKNDTTEESVVYNKSIDVYLIKSDDLIRKTNKNVPDRVKSCKSLMHLLDVSPMFYDWTIVLSYKTKGKIEQKHFSHNSNPAEMARLIELSEGRDIGFRICADFKRISFYNFVRTSIQVIRRLCYMFYIESNYLAHKPEYFSYIALNKVFFHSHHFCWKKYDTKFWIEDYLNPCNSLEQFDASYRAMFDIDNDVQVVRKKDIDMLFDDWNIAYPEDKDLAYNMFGLTEDTGFRISSFEHGNKWQTNFVDLMVKGTGADEQPFVRMSELCKLLRKKIKTFVYAYRIVFCGQKPGCIVYDELEDIGDYQIMPNIRIYNNKDQTIIFDDIALTLMQIEGLMDNRNYTFTCMCISRFQGWTTLEFRSGGTFTLRIESKVDF